MNDKTNDISKLQKDNLLLKQQLETEKKKKKCYQTQLKNLKNTLTDVADRLELASKLDDVYKQRYQSILKDLLLKHNTEVDELQQTINNLLMSKTNNNENENEEKCYEK